MYLSPKDRLLLNPSLRDFSNWPDVPMDLIPKDKRKKFDRNKRIVSAVLGGKKYRVIAKSYGVSKGRISTLLHKALGGNEEASPLLTYALIPYKRHGVSKRRKPLSSLTKVSGSKAAFLYLLDHVEDLRKKLDEVIKKDIEDDPSAPNLTPQLFHGFFLLFLEEAGHPKNSYPYTEDSQAYESARLYYHKRRKALELKRIEKKSAISRITEPKQKPFCFGRELQLDEHTWNGESCIYLDFDDHYIPIRLSRFSVVVLSDVDTTVALSFFIALTVHPSQFDILQTLESATLFTSVAELQTPGLHLPPGPAFPNNINEEIVRVAIESLSLDNALAHCADTIEEYVCDTHYGTLRLGLPGVPLARRVVEGINRHLSRAARTHKSTTGNNVTDPIKESNKNRKRPPYVTLFNLEEIAYAILARHNHNQPKNLFGSTPLQLCEHSFQNHLNRLLPRDHFKRRSPLILRKQVTVKWLRDERRFPHIHFYHCKYQGEGLNKEELINKEVIVEYDYRDIRKLDVYTLANQYICTVYAPQSWQRFAHGVKTRQYIYKYTRKYNMTLTNPLVEFFWIQLNRPKSAKGALEAVRLYREYTKDIEQGIPALQTALDNSPVQSINKSIKKSSFNIPDWSTEIVHDKN